MGEFEYRLVTLMDEQGMSQAELARRTGISTSSMNRYLAGADIPASKLKAIAAALGVPVDELLDTGMLPRYSLTADEYELIAIFNKLDERDKKRLLTFARTMLD